MALQDRIFNPFVNDRDWPVAYALAILSHVAYRTNPQFINTWADIIGLPTRAIYQTPGREIPNFVIAGQFNRFIVAIPGTDSPVQMVNNIRYSGQRDAAPYGTGKVHSFFHYCADGIADFVKNTLNGMSIPLEIVFVGHSLGGAVAQLLADYIETSTGHTVKLCATFNAPRVGNYDWATLPRSYPSHLYYNTHDMVCELPLPVHVQHLPGTIAGLVLVDYQHRYRLVPIESLMKIDESWIAVGVAKVVYPAKWLLNIATRAPLAASFANVMGKVGHFAAWASWVLPLPAWVTEHWISATVNNIESIIESSSFPEKPQLRNLATTLNGTDSIFIPNVNTNFALRPVSSFAPGVNPGNGEIANLPTIPPGTRYETIEAAADFSIAPAAESTRNLIDVRDSFIDALMAAAPSAPSGNPLLLTQQVVADTPARPNWLYKGDDRRMLLKLRQVLQGIEARDLIALDDAPTSAISTRDLVIPPDDTTLLDSFYAVQDRVDELLSIAIED